MSPAAQRLPGDKINQRIGVKLPFERRPTTDIENVNAAMIAGDVIDCTIDARKCAAKRDGVLRCKERIRKMNGKRNRRKKQRSRGRVCFVEFDQTMHPADDFFRASGELLGETVRKGIKCFREQFLNPPDDDAHVACLGHGTAGNMTFYVVKRSKPQLRLTWNTTQCQLDRW